MDNFSTTVHRSTNWAIEGTGKIMVIVLYIPLASTYNAMPQSSKFDFKPPQGM